MREQAYSALPPLLDAMTPALLPYLDKPFALFGHSMGAIIAFELARKLRRDFHVRSECLIVSARVAPTKPLPRPPICRLGSTEFKEALRDLNGTPREVLENAELMTLLMGLLRADFAVHEEYRYSEGAPLECPIIAFAGTADPEASPEDIEAWREFTTGRFEKRVIPGDHFYIVTAKALLLRFLSQDLDEIAMKLRGFSSG
jgi:surfactin synthase thioesterase subunit